MNSKTSEELCKKALSLEQAIAGDCCNSEDILLLEAIQGELSKRGWTCVDCGKIINLASCEGYSVCDTSGDTYCSAHWHDCDTYDETIK